MLYFFTVLLLFLEPVALALPLSASRHAKAADHNANVLERTSSTTSNLLFRRSPASGWYPGSTNPNNPRQGGSGSALGLGHNSEYSSQDGSGSGLDWGQNSIYPPQDGSGSGLDWGQNSIYPPQDGSGSALGLGHNSEYSPQDGSGSGLHWGQNSIYSPKDGSGSASGGYPGSTNPTQSYHLQDYGPTHPQAQYSSSELPLWKNFQSVQGSSLGSTSGNPDQASHETTGRPEPWHGAPWLPFTPPDTMLRYAFPTNFQQGHGESTHARYPPLAQSQYGYAPEDAQRYELGGSTRYQNPPAQDYTYSEYAGPGTSQNQQGYATSGHFQNPPTQRDASQGSSREETFPLRYAQLRPTHGLPEPPPLAQPGLPSSEHAGHTHSESALPGNSQDVPEGSQNAAEKPLVAASADRINDMANYRQVRKSRFPACANCRSTRKKCDTDAACQGCKTSRITCKSGKSEFSASGKPRYYA